MHTHFCYVALSKGIFLQLGHYELSHAHTTLHILQHGIKVADQEKEEFVGYTLSFFGQRLYSIGVVYRPSA